MNYDSFIKDVNPMIQTFLSFASCIIAWYIPIRIMRNQRYESLLQEYMSNNYGDAIQGVINFYVETCKSKVELIPLEYNKLFEQKDKFSKLHNQRRLLNNFFWQLNSCAKSSFSLKRKIQKEFTKSEAYICKILIYMNNAVDENPKIFKDISNIKYENMPQTKGINKSLKNIFVLLKNQNRWID